MVVISRTFCRECSCISTVVTPTIAVVSHPCGNIPDEDGGAPFISKIPSSLSTRRALVAATSISSIIRCLLDQKGLFLFVPFFGSCSFSRGDPPLCSVCLSSGCTGLQKGSRLHLLLGLGLTNKNVQSFPWIPSNPHLVL